MMLLALVYGFTGALPRIDAKPLQGVALVCLGLAAIWVPLQFSIAALFVGMGTRLIWIEVAQRKLTVQVMPKARILSVRLDQNSTNEVARQR
jgi:hypothetical protein